MKKAVLLSVCLLTILGCSSLPDRKNPDQTIAVLKVNRVFFDNRDQETKKPEKYMPLHVYYITIDDDPKLHVIQQEYEQYIITDLAPGAHRISSILLRLTSSSMGKETVIPVSVPFELKPGFITILPKSFNISIQMSGDYSYRTGQGFADLKPEERTTIVEKLSTYPAFKTWELAE
jgi:hypothetical protein